MIHFYRLIFSVLLLLTAFTNINATNVIRFINLIYEQPVEIYIDGAKAKTVNFGVATEYINITTGQHDFVVLKTGNSTKDTIINKNEEIMDSSFAIFILFLGYQGSADMFALNYPDGYYYNPIEGEVEIDFWAYSSKVRNVDLEISYSDNRKTFFENQNPGNHGFGFQVRHIPVGLSKAKLSDYSSGAVLFDGQLELQSTLYYIFFTGGTVQESFRVFAFDVFNEEEQAPMAEYKKPSFSLDTL